MSEIGLKRSNSADEQSEGDDEVDLDAPPIKKSKHINESWFNEYKNIFNISNGMVSKVEKNISKSKDTKTIIEQWLKEYQNIFLQPSDCGSVSQFQNNLTETQIPVNITLNEQSNLCKNQVVDISVENQQHKSQPIQMGYWGPLLRYGTYGIYKRYGSSIVLVKNSLLKNKIEAQVRMISNISFYPPLHIQMPRQAMIWTLQTKSRRLISDLQVIENDPEMHKNISYSTYLEKITNQCGTCPKYIFSKFYTIPDKEKEYFTGDEPINHSIGQVLSLDGAELITIRPIDQYYCCELFISDIIFSQTFSQWKTRAKEACAREAIRMLSNPNCEIVSALRFWRDTDFYTAVATPDSSTAPIMPPFITDPTEPLFKKDEKICRFDPEQNFDISNPKSRHDFWLFAPQLSDRKLIKTLHPELLLRQSAEFSQMHLSYELETNWAASKIQGGKGVASTGFSCTLFLDKTIGARVSGLASLQQARRVASLVLVDRLISTQPLISIEPSFFPDYEKILFESGSNKGIVESLAWDKDSLLDPISIDTLLNMLVEQDLLCSESKSNRNWNQELDKLFMLYMQSCVIKSIRIKHKSVKEVILLARQNGLLAIEDEPAIVDNDNDDDDLNRSIIVCKQMPNIQLRSQLLRDGCCGVYKLLSEGKLSSNYLDELNRYYDCHYTGGNFANSGSGGGISGTVIDDADVSDVGCNLVNDHQLNISSNLSINKNVIPSNNLLNDFLPHIIPGIDF